MRGVRKSPWSRWVAWVLATTLFVPGFWLSAPNAAQAQEPQRRVIVLDFDTVGRIDKAIGPRAAAALVIELSEAGGVQVVSEQDVREAMAQEPKMTPPLDKDSQIALAKRVPGGAVTSIINGRVTELSVGEKQARVTLEVLEMDVASGENVNGARVAGDTGAKLAATPPEALINEALSRAARTAVLRMKETILPAGNVLQVDAFGEVTLSIGLRNGVAQGQRYAVTREIYNRTTGEYETTRVGTIRIRNVEPQFATARIEQSTVGIRTGDRVRMTFSLAALAAPIMGVGREAPSGDVDTRSKTGALTSFLVPVALLGVLLGGINKSSKGGTVSIPPDAPLVRAGSLPNTVLVQWRNPGNIGENEIIGTIVHRSTTPGFSPDVSLDAYAFLSGNATQFIDDATAAVQAVNVTVDATTGLIQFGTGTGTTLPGPGARAASIAFTANRTGVTPGTRYFYAVTRITRLQPQIQPPTSGGTGGGGQQQAGFALAVTRPSAASEGATPLTSPGLLNPPERSQDVNLRDVTFQWTRVPGADQYQVQISASNAFPRNSRFASDPISDGSLPEPPAKRFTNLFVPGAAQGAQMFWRVGARNTLDGRSPVGLAGTQANNPNDDGFVWSAPRPFTVADLPPGPPGNPQRVLTPVESAERAMGLRHRKRGDGVERNRRGRHGRRRGKGKNDNRRRHRNRDRDRERDR